MIQPLARCLGAGPHSFTDRLVAEPEATYHANRATYLSSHALADFRRCPLLFRRKELGLIPDEDRPAFAFGRAAHCLILEGREAFEARYAVGGPVNPKTGRTFGVDTKAYAEWAAQQGKPTLSDDAAVLLARLDVAVRGHEQTQKLLGDGVPEGVVRAGYAGLRCQARLDWTHPERGIIDLKTIDNLDFFQVEARSFGYVHQMAFYRAVLAAACGRNAEVHLIAVEKREPFRCGVWRIEPQVLDAAERDNAAAIQRLIAARERDVWPTGYEDFRVIDHL